MSARVINTWLALAILITIGCGGKDVDDADGPGTIDATSGSADGTGNNDGNDGSGTLTDSGTTGEDGGIDSSVPSLPPCEVYIQCVAENTPKDLDSVLAAYGKGGSCWLNTPHLCRDACVVGTISINQILDATEICNVCKTSDDCPSSLPGCKLSVGQCVECTVNDDCTDDEKPGCNPDTNSCVTCTLDFHCANRPMDQRRCDTTNHTCVACTANTDCQISPNGPVCDPVTHICRGCLTDDECVPNVCLNGTCVQCRTDADCNGTKCMLGGFCGTASTAWTCDPLTYNTGNFFNLGFCDCGCGEHDPDCDIPGIRMGGKCEPWDTCVNDECVAGQCSTDTCTWPEECCSGYCSNGHCDTEGCRIRDEACEHSWQCCHGTCENNYCECKNSGSCQDDNECCSGWCKQTDYGMRCNCGEVGDWCDDNSECCGNLCVPPKPNYNPVCH